MSDIYGDLYADLEPNRFKRGVAFNPVLTALGSAWENHLEFLLDKNGVQVMRPGELFTVEDNIAYSPDGILADGRLVEYKLSSMGTQDLPTTPVSGFPPKFGKYVCQMKLYCHHLETSRARLYFCSIRSPYDPELLCFDIEFTARELQEEWQMARNHAVHKGLL